MFHPYLSILQTSGVNVKPLYISISITRFNRHINRIGRIRSRFLKTWFNIGAVVTILIIFPTLVLYVISLYQLLKSTSISEYSESLLMPVIPGYNFPSSHFLYYAIIVLFCSAIHEFGHALAASRELVCVEDFGFAMLGVFSLAFVNLRSDQFKQASLWEQLRILCAGIWHNIVLSLIAFLLWFSIFYTLTPLYHIGNGVSVLRIHELSALNHPAGFQIGDQIKKIGNCQVQDTESWKRCIRHLSDHPSTGFCIPHTVVTVKTDFMNKEKCNSSEYLLFHAKHEEKDFCIKAREVIANFASCNQTSDCENTAFCAFPVLSMESHRFVAIKRHYKPDVLYEGSMAELCSDVGISDFVPKFRLFPASFPEFIILILQYTIMFSSGLAVVNVLPGFFLDGMYIMENLIHLCLENYVLSYNKRNRIVVIVNRIGFVMLVSMVFCSVKHYMYS